MASGHSPRAGKVRKVGKQAILLLWWRCGAAIWHFLCTFVRVTLCVCVAVCVWVWFIIMQIRPSRWVYLSASAGGKDGLSVLTAWRQPPFSPPSLLVTFHSEFRYLCARCVFICRYLRKHTHTHNGTDVHTHIHRYTDTCHTHTHVFMQQLRPHVRCHVLCQRRCISTICAVRTPYPPLFPLPLLLSITSTCPSVC